MKCQHWAVNIQCQYWGKYKLMIMGEKHKLPVLEEQ
jgi:hypothetical protein